MANSTEVSVIDVYQRHGVAWAKLRSSRLVERAWIDRFCGLIPEGGLIVDIGCGSGPPIAGELIGQRWLGLSEQPRGVVKWIAAG